jgi:predicted nucleic acid-binding protein
MGAIDLARIPRGALLLLDSSPVIYYFEDHPKLADRYEPIFRAYTRGDLRLAITPVTVAEVLIGPLLAGDEVDARRYRAVFDAWEFVAPTAEIAESAARLRASFRLKLPDAFQAASALAINATALVSSDRDFSRVRSLRVIS